MIIIKLQGGLGNQLFQYAAGRALSIATGKQMVFDLYYLYGTKLSIKNETPRSFELNPYQLGIKITSPSKRSAIFPRKLIKYWYTTLHYKKYADRITENNFAEASSIPGNLLLDGYFQDERYFISIRELLVREIRLPVLPQSYEIYRKNIEGSNSAAVHIRRGDYISNAAASKFHGTLPLSYYRQAFLPEGAIWVIPEEINADPTEVIEHIAALAGLRGQHPERLGGHGIGRRPLTG